MSISHTTGRCTKLTILKCAMLVKFVKLPFCKQKNIIRVQLEKFDGKLKLVI